MQLGVPINGTPILHDNNYTMEFVCNRCLGKTPEKPDLVGRRLKLSWLQTQFPVDENSSEEEVGYATRAYILELIGGVLMPDKSGNLVHSQYLPFIGTFRYSRECSWGSAILSFLYREMCKASIIVNDNVPLQIGGCLMLLQSWAWHRLPFLTPISRTSVNFPLAGR